MPRINPIAIICKGCGSEHPTLSPHKTKYCSIKCARKFQIIKPFTEEHKRKIRESNLRTWSKPEVRNQSVGENNPMFGKTTGYSGEKHHNWKGGVSAKSKMQRCRFLQVFQPQVLARDDYTCQVCYQYGEKLQVDHIKSWADYPELRFDLDNCRTLCMACHYYLTFKRKLPQGVVWGHNLSSGIA